MPRRAHKQGPFWRRLVFSKEVLEWPWCTPFSRIYELHIHRDAWPPTHVAEPTSLAPQQKTEEEQRIPAISRAPRKRQKGGGIKGRGFTDAVRLRSPPAAPPERRVSLASQPIRRPQGARPRPRPLWSHLRVPYMPSRARAQKRAAGARAREKGGCTSLRASQAARTPA